MTFLRNIVSDMRDKHLLPVAIGLVAIAIAVPLALKKESKPAPVAKSEPGASAAATGTGSPVAPFPEPTKASETSLAGFKKKDPFVQLGQKRRGDSGSTGASAGDTVAPGEGSGGSQGGGGSGGGDTTTTPGETSPSEVKFYSWAVDLRFGLADGKLRHHNDLTSIEFFPSESYPLIALIGTSTDGRTAIFMPTEGVGQHGEGTCQPSNSKCTFLYLREDKGHNRHTIFLYPSRPYTLLLDRIHLKSVTPEGSAVRGSGGSTSKMSGSVKSSRRQESVPFNRIMRMRKR